MSRTVRIAAVGSDFDMRWPPRCPRCAVDFGLVPSTVRVGRARFDRSGRGDGFQERTEMMTMSVPMCQRHADANDFANMVLEGSALMTALRTVAIVACLKFVMLTWAFVAHGGSRHAGPVVLLALAAVGVGGVSVMRWAATNAAVRAVGFDRGTNVLAIRFSDEAYAAEFVDINPVDTDPAATTRAPWYERYLLVEIVLAVLALAWLGGGSRH